MYRQARENKTQYYLEDTSEWHTLAADTDLLSFGAKKFANYYLVSAMEKVFDHMINFSLISTTPTSQNQNKAWRPPKTNSSTRTG